MPLRECDYKYYHPLVMLPYLYMQIKSPDPIRPWRFYRKPHKGHTEIYGFFYIKHNNI